MKFNGKNLLTLGLRSSNSECRKQQHDRSHVEPFHGLAKRSKLCKSHVSFDILMHV